LPGDLPINLAGASLQANEEWGHQIFDATYTSLWDAFRRQHRAQQALSVVAPLLAVRSVSMALAGTDFEQHRDFASAAETYRRRLIQTMNDAVASNAVGYTGDAGPWSRVDAFEYVAPGVTWVLGNERWALTALAAWLLVAALSASVAVRRLQIL
jgi:ABC-2 type transport system permease protein